jgi:transposase, IS5 family
LKQGYRSLLNATSAVVGQAKRFSAEIVQGVKRATSVFKQVALGGLRQELTRRSEEFCTDADA